MDYIEEIEYKNHRIRIAQDHDPLDPEEGDCPVYLVHFHRQFGRCPDEVPFSGEDEAQWFLNGPDKRRADYEEELAEWKDDRKGWKVFPVSAYIHSGVSLSLGHGSGWDVSNCGAILIKDDGEWFDGNLTDERAEEIAEAHVKEWNQYLNGEVYGFMIDGPLETHQDLCEKCGHVQREYEEREVLDSCWGFYGLDYCIEEAKGMVDYQLNKE